MRFLLSIFILSLSSNSFGQILNGIDLAQVETELEGDGAIGWVHGAAAPFKMFVFTYRGKEFFKYVDFPMIADNGDVAKAFAKLRRHDKIRIQGMFVDNMAPITHLLVTNIEVIKKFEPKTPVPPYKHNTRLPKDLINVDHFIGKIHGVSPDGKYLVVEYKDAIIPLISRDLNLTKGLFRNDIVKIHHVIRKSPKRPAHIAFSPTVAEPLEVLDSMVKNHGGNITLEGELALFPKSPQIKFNIYALKVKFPNSIARNFTIVNFTNMNKFKAIRMHLEALWEQGQAKAVGARNHLVNPSIKLRINGIKNVISPVQANPQILVDSIGDIQVL